jgi:hypothetical protein
LQVGDGPLYRVETVNISVAGIMVFSPQSLDVGSDVSFVPPHIDGDEPHILTGRVVRKERRSVKRGHAFGIQIQSEEGNRETLSKWLLNLKGPNDMGSSLDTEIK